MGEIARVGGRGFGAEVWVAECCLRSYWIRGGLWWRNGMVWAGGLGR